MRTLRIALFAALLPVAAAAQTQLPNMSPGTVLGVMKGGSARAPTAIPFATLSSQLTGASITLNSGNGQTAPGAMSGGNTYTFGGTGDTPQMTGLGLGGTAPVTGLKVYNAPVNPGGTGQGSVGSSSTNGGGLIGQGSVYDSFLGNLSGLPAVGVTTNTRDVVLLGKLTAASLQTTGVVAGSLCATSGGAILYEVGVNCFAVSGVSITAGKTLTVTNTLTLSGTDATTFIYPGSNDTLAGLGANQTFTGTDTFSGTLNITGTGQINGTAFGTFATQNYATPPAIGGTTPNTGAFSTLTATTPIGLTSGGTNASTAAGARASGGLNVDGYTAKGDTSYTILASDRTVGTSTTFTAPRTWTLPAASAVNSGQELIVVDMAGGVTNTNTLTVSRAGSDTINGGTTVTINVTNGAYLFRSDGNSKWTAQQLGAQATVGVSSINGQTGNPSIVAGTGVSVGTSGGNITVANTGVTSVTGNGLTVTSTGTLPPRFGLINQSIAVSAAGGALTVALKDNAGNDPSATSPVTGFFRSGNGSTIGSWTQLSVTSALSVTIPSGATMDVTSSTAFRIWVVLFNDAGTARLGVINCSDASNIYPLNEGILTSSTAISSSSNSGGVFYTGSAVTTKAFLIVGYIDWTTSGVTAGTWTTTNVGYVQTFGPGVKKPGDLVQTVMLSMNTAATLSSTTYASTGFSKTINLTWPANLVKVTMSGSFTANVNAKRTYCQVFRNGAAAPNGPEKTAFIQSGAAIISDIDAIFYDKPNGSSPAYAIYCKIDSGGGGNFPDGTNTSNAQLILEEVMG